MWRATHTASTDAFDVHAQRLSREALGLQLGPASRSGGCVGAGARSCSVGPGVEDARSSSWDCGIWRAVRAWTKRHGPVMSGYIRTLSWVESTVRWSITQCHENYM